MEPPVVQAAATFCPPELGVFPCVNAPPGEAGVYFDAIDSDQL